MPNSHVFTGLDGAITVAVETGVEGDAAKAVNDTYGLTPIGRATGVNVEVTSDIRPFHEIGQRYATELRQRQRQRRGHDRAGARQRRPAQADARRRRAPAADRAVSFVSPTFNLSLRMENSAFPGNASTVTRARREARPLVVHHARGRLRDGDGRVQGAVDRRRGRRSAGVT